MKEINGYLLVKVNKGAHDFGIIGSLYKDSTQMLWYNDFYGHDASCEKQLPKGNYSIIGLAKDLTEKQWRRIVENDANFGDSLTSIKFPYKNYQTFMLQCKTATESGHSLLKANNLNPNTTLILKQVV